MAILITATAIPASVAFWAICPAVSIALATIALVSLASTVADAIRKGRKAKDHPIWL
jgi:hypothetical protein